MVISTASPHDLKYSSGPHLTGGTLVQGLLMIAIMWQFDVKAGREAEFEQMYGADGAWTTMNRHTRSYLGSSFLHDQNRAARYILIERRDARARSISRRDVAIGNAPRQLDCCTGVSLSRDCLRLLSSW